MAIVGLTIHTVGCKAGVVILTGVCQCDVIDQYTALN